MPSSLIPEYERRDQLASFLVPPSPVSHHASQSWNKAVSSRRPSLTRRSRFSLRFATCLADLLASVGLTPPFARRACRAGQPRQRGRRRWPCRHGETKLKRKTPPQTKAQTRNFQNGKTTHPDQIPRPDHPIQSPDPIKLSDPQGNPAGAPPERLFGSGAALWWSAHTPGASARRVFSREGFHSATCSGACCLCAHPCWRRHPCRLYQEEL